MDKKTILSPEKQALLDQRLKGALYRLSESKTITARIKGEPAVLSYSQQQLWIVDQMQPGNPAYNVPVLFEIKGQLDIQRLQESFNEVIKRHEVLRTSFTTKDNQPYQITHPELKIKIDMVDLSGFSSEGKETKFQNHVSLEVIKSFNLSKLPLIRVSLYKLDEGEYKLLLNIHHIVADGWSVGLIINEVGAIYDGKYSTLPVLPMQYADYSILDKKRLEENNYEKQISYWKEVLREELPVLELPLDKPRPAVQTFVGSNRFFSINKSLAAKLHFIALRQGATSFMLIITAYQILLHRYSGQDDIIVGVPVSTRTRNEYEKLVGYFLNMTAFRIDLSDDPTFKELLKKEREVTINAFSNQEVPFEKVVESLKFKRDLSRNPVFQTTLEVSPGSSYKLKDLQFEQANLDTRFSQVDLAIHLSEDNGGFTGRIEYNTDLFDEQTITRFTNHFINLLSSIAENPEKNISDYSLLSTHESEFLISINSTSVDYKGPQCLNKLVEEQAVKTPDNIAVEFNNEKLTYKQLNEEANRLANYLISIGVKSEEPVAICVERSLQLLIGLLGILKTGAPYLPLDIDYPIDRLEYMLEDSATRFLISTKNLTENFPHFKGKTILLDNNEKILKGLGTAPDVEIKPENSAYIIYTSGSTGKPKGAINTHRGITNYIKSLQEYYQLTTNDIALQKTPISFDVSVREIFLPLSTGAKLVLARQDGHKDNAYLINLIRSKQVTFISFVPSQLNSILMERDISKCTSIRQMVCSGEALSPAIVKLFFEKLDAELDNLYGPTEAAVDVTRWKCTKEIEFNSVPIGKPIPNNKIYILDKNLNPVPVKVKGEICIGGIQLARGYLNRDQLTSEKFCSDPFSKDSGSRIYKTGDLGRFLDDGTIEYLGRQDNQVKIRGFRIELGEIEKVLESSEEVGVALVIGKEFAAGDQRLITYLIPRPGKSADVGKIKSFLSEKLPDYMIPSYYVKLEKFPLTPNGKIDRKKLPAPAAERFSERDYIAPQNQLEKTIADIWQKYLSLNKIGIDDNFFDLGGHSLMFTQVLSRLKKITTVSISLKDLFDTPTIRGISEKIINKGKDTAAESIPKLKKVSRESYNIKK